MRQLDALHKSVNGCWGRGEREQVMGTVAAAATPGRRERATLVRGDACHNRPHTRHDTCEKLRRSDRDHDRRPTHRQVRVRHAGAGSGSAAHAQFMSSGRGEYRLALGPRGDRAPAGDSGPASPARTPWVREGGRGLAAGAASAAADRCGDSTAGVHPGSSAATADGGAWWCSGYRGASSPPCAWPCMCARACAG